LNDELISEIKRIKGEEVSSKPNNFVEVGSSNSNLGSLKTEVKKLKNNLALKSEELKSLRYRNDSLEGRITQLESAPNIPKDDLLPRISKLNTTSKYSDPVTTINLSGNCNLQFEAVVTSLNGKSKEAFYTEFFVLPYNLEQIVRKGGIELNNYSEIDTYAELWARSRKNAFLFPDIHKKIRSLLLDFEDKGEGKRIRTDVDGSASISGIKTGKYYVIGTAALGKVGVTWSVPVTLNPGNNKISLTLANCSWSL
jgi:regulator of replication initiation timing